MAVKLNTIKLFSLRFLPALFLLILPKTVKATEVNEGITISLSSPQVLQGVILVLIIFIILVLIFTLLVFNSFVKKIRMELPKKALEQAPELSWWEQLKLKMTDAVPVKEEAVVLTDHEYDGIRELDNNLPPWWRFMFYATIVFSVIYIWHYHFSDGVSQEEEYYAEMKMAEKRIAEYKKKAGDMIDETNVILLTGDEELVKGEIIYKQNCAACHGQNMEGGVGPDLKDGEWLHGGDVKDVFKSIKYGIPQKGMIAWEGQLSPVQIQEVASFILSKEESK